MLTQNNSTPLEFTILKRKGAKNGEYLHNIVLLRMNFIFLKAIRFAGTRIHVCKFATKLCEYNPRLNYISYSVLHIIN